MKSFRNKYKNLKLITTYVILLEITGWLKYSYYISPQTIRLDKMTKIQKQIHSINCQSNALRSSHSQYFHYVSCIHSFKKSTALNIIFNKNLLVERNFCWIFSFNYWIRPFINYFSLTRLALKLCIRFKLLAYVFSKFLIFFS